MDYRTTIFVNWINTAAESKRMSARQFCQDEKIEITAFYRWQNGQARISDRTCKALLVKLRRTPEDLERAVQDLRGSHVDYGARPTTTQGPQHPIDPRVLVSMPEKTWKLVENIVLMQQGEIKVIPLQGLNDLRANLTTVVSQLDQLD